MNSVTRLALTIGIGLSLALNTACIEDDWDPDAHYGDDDTGVVDDDTGVVEDTNTDTAPDPQLAGKWTSQGNDVSPLFKGDPFNIVLVEATFRADGSYSVYTQDDAGTGADLSGSYTVDRSVNPHEITLQQTEPYAATSEGLYAVSSGVLTYEVVQTVPDYGFSPPEGDFGTTSGPNMTPDINVQVYRR